MTTFRSMKAVGVKELKARLSEYIRYVKAGEAVLVTERGDVVAELRPVRESYATPPGDAALEVMVAKGEVREPTATKGDWTWCVQGAGLEEGTALRLLDDLREDR